MVLGAVAGGFGAALAIVASWIRFESVLYFLFNLALVGLGLHFFGMRLPGALEAAGFAAWNSVLAHSPEWVLQSKARGSFLCGVVWGLVPCAAVYSILPLAVLSGSALDGALILLLFGTATVPGHILIASGYGRAKRAGRRLRPIWLARTLGAAVVLWGVVGAGFALGVAERPTALLATWCTAQ
jgi:sulfite exporter TauE/SafE